MLAITTQSGWAGEAAGLAEEACFVGSPFITLGGMKVEAAITISLALFNLQLGRCDQPSQGPPKALQRWQWRKHTPLRQSACAVLTGVPIHITPLASMIQCPALLPLLLTATGGPCPCSSPEDHRKPLIGYTAL